MRLLQWRIPVSGPFKLFVFILTASLLLLTGCAQNSSVSLDDDPDDTTVKKVFSGKVLKKSNRTRTISLEVVTPRGPAVLTIGFTDTTRGIDHAVQDKMVIITANGPKDNLLATVVKPDLSGFTAGVAEIKVKKIKNMISDDDDFMLIDSRPSAAYAAGHLVGAVSLPSCTMRQNLNRLPEKKSRLLVFYCGSTDCSMSTRASAEAARAGYTNIRVMKGGVEAWTAAGYRIVATDDFALKSSTVLIDLRAGRYDAVDRIAGSVSIPFAEFAGRIDKISIKAPVVVYSNNIQESLTALSLLRNAGFKHVAMVDGNFQGWKRRKKPTTSGAVNSTINWQRKLSKGEVSPATFTRAVNTAGHAVILDVRTSAETAAGSFRNARLIPLNDLAQRMSELPRSKNIYVYSATGARAAMAQRLLIENGLAASFVVGNVLCSGGTCKIRY